MFYFIAFGWIIGIACMGQAFTSILELSLPVNILLFIFLFLELIFYRKISTYLFKFLCCSSAFILSLVLGLNYADHHLVQRLELREKQVEDVTVLIYVKHISELRENSFQQKIEVLNRKSKPVQWFSSVELDQGDFELGKYFRVSGKLRPAHGYATDGSFDIEKWYIQQNIMGNLKVSTFEEISPQEVQQFGYMQYVKQQDTWLSQSLVWIEKQRLLIRQFIQIQPIRHKGLTLALLTGDESLLDKNLEQQFQRFGMSHLLAISGPHVVIFAVIICWLIQYLIDRFKPDIYLKIPRQYLLIYPFLSCVIIYCAYVGFEIPALRTLLVCILGSLFILLKQSIKPLSLLLLSACILLFFDPFSVLSAAFWLSYGACFILLRIYQTIQNDKLEQASFYEKCKHYIGALIESQWKIFIALFPLMIIFFNQISWITPLSNLFAIPWIGLIIVPLDIFGGISYFFFKPLSTIIFQLNDLMLSLLLHFIQLLDDIFNPQLYPIYLNIWALAGLILALIILFMPKGIVPRAWSILCIIPIFLGQQSSETFEFVLLDVGQGQSIFIRNENKKMLLDTGGSFDEDKFSIGEQVILPFLSIKNSRKLDILILSHLDQDHSGAYFKIKNQLYVQQLYSNEILEDHDHNQLCERGKKIDLGSNIDIQVLLPHIEDLTKKPFNKNEMSCVIYLQLAQAYPYQNYLFMGDAGWETEFKLLQLYPNLKVDVLVLGHHGSQHSSAYDFLKNIRPKIALISAGFDNRYGHPSGKTIQRLKHLNIPYLSTADVGTIKIKKNKTGQTGLRVLRNQKKWLKK